MMRDAKGVSLSVGDTVRLLPSYADEVANVGERVGVVQHLPGPESDYYGWPHVAFSGATAKAHHVPNTAVVKMTQDREYMAAQVRRLTGSDGYAVQLRSADNQTHWMSITSETFARVVRALIDPE